MLLTPAPANAMVPPLFRGFRRFTHRQEKPFFSCAQGWSRCWHRHGEEGKVMANKSRMALAGLALGTVILSGCWNSCRQTYSGTGSAHNRTPTASGKQDWSNSPAARQTAPLGAQPAFSGANSTTSTLQQAYQMPGQVQPTGIPPGTSQNYRQPASMGIPASPYHSVPGVPGTSAGVQASPTGNLTSTPLPQASPTTSGVPTTSRPIQTAPFPQAPAPGFPSAASDSPVGPAMPYQPLP